MLRVLTISTLYPNAEQPNFGRFVAEQTRRLAARDDVELKVLAPLGLPPAPVDRLPPYAALRRLPSRETWAGVETHRPRFRLVPKVGWRRNPERVAAALEPVLDGLAARGFRPDVIDGEFFYPCGVAAAALGRRLGIPVSLKARGSDIHYWSGLPPALAMMREAAHSAAGLLSVSAALRRDMATLGFDEAKIAVHYTGVELERFRGMERAPAKARLGVAGPLILSIGSLIPIKGHDRVIRALAALPEARLMIAGSGPERRALEQLAQAAGVAARVRFLGQVSHDRVPGLLAAADVMALASEREGLANVWVESLAAGTPIVIPAIGSAREVVTGPHAGRIVAERQPEALAEAIRILLDYPPPADAVRRAAERFTWSRNTDTLHAHLAAMAAR